MDFLIGVLLDLPLAEAILQEFEIVMAAVVPADG